MNIKRLVDSKCLDICHEIFRRFAIVIIDDVYFSISAAIKPIELFDKIRRFRWI